MRVRIHSLKTNHLTQPLGFDCRRVLLSWRVADCAGHWMSAARVQLALAPQETCAVYDTGLLPCAHDPQTGRILSGPDNLGWLLPHPLAPRTRYFWRVFVRTDAGETAWSAWTWFETAKMQEPWQARFIASPFGAEVHPIFLRRFTVKKPLRRARLYCLGLGVYEAWLNGRRVGDEVLLPGLHAYDGYQQTQTLALEPVQGENTMAFLLGDGWYKGRYGLKRSAPRYGTDYALIAELRLTYEDGTEELITTDERWQVRVSPITFDGIYDGETVDARLLTRTEECPACPSPMTTARLTDRVSPCIRVQETRMAQRVPGEEYILDFGQNMVGWVSFPCDAPAGTVITLRFAETLRDGRLYLDNLRTAKATFTYISDGTRREVRPHFTFFGFRYVSVDGWMPPPEDLTGCVIHSDMERTGWIKTGHEKLNRLVENVLWSQKGNFLDVPTDCPQRDERMGWTGDIQIFADTALYQMDCTAFLAKFLRDLRHDQRSLGGSVPCVTPMAGYRLGGVAAWGDAATIVPWQMYLHSGNEGILRDSLQSMIDWVEWIRRETEAAQTAPLWLKGQQLGDWLALDGSSVYGGTERGMIATAYYYASAVITAKSAQVLGRTETAHRYAALADGIRTAFQREFFTPNGRIAVSTQTACALTRMFSLVPPEGEARVDELLCRLVLEAGIRLDTGFVGTPCLLPALTRAGHAELAYGLLLREDYPGWLYEVERGATTIWERWNSIGPDGSMNRDGMNSFNHYAYGAVAAWMYRTMGGIAPVADAPGFRCIACTPVPSRRIPWAETRLMTGHGLCAVRWEWQASHVLLTLTVPFGCRMRLRLPDGRPPVELDSGVHSFDVCMPEDEPWGLRTSWRALLNDPKTRAVVEEHFPRALQGIAFQNEMYTMEQVTQSPFSELSREEIRQLAQALTEAQCQG